MNDKIAQLRASAKRFREAAHHADRKSDYDADMQRAAKRDQEADEPEKQLQAGV